MTENENVTEQEPEVTETEEVEVSEEAQEPKAEESKGEEKEEAQAPDLDPETLQAAVEVYQALQEPDGVLQLWFETGRAMGLSVDAMARLLAGGHESTPSQGAEEDVDLEEEEDEDRPLTKAEVQRILEERQAEQAQAQVMSAIRDWYESSGLTPDEYQMVLAVADAGFDGDLHNPKDVISALEKAKAKVEEEAERIARRRASSQPKAKQEERPVPKRVKGHGSAGPPEQEPPKSLDEAMKRVRARLLAEE